MADRSEFETVALTIEGGIAWVKFNRPEKRNSMSPKLNRQMKKVLEEIEFREDVGVLVLSGEGEAWSAGMDLKEYFRETEAEGLHAIRRSQREAYGWWERLRWYEKPTIAMVNGWCFGGGYGPLYACDIALAAEEAQFGLSEINWGILPGGGAAKVAANLMPLRKAMYHAMMGENLAAPSRRAGLGHRSRARSRLEARVVKSPSAAQEGRQGAARDQGCGTQDGRDDLDNAEDYLIRAQEALHSYGGIAARKEATKQFLDDKSFKPGLGAFDISKVKD